MRKRIGKLILATLCCLALLPGSAGALSDVDMLPDPDTPPDDDLLAAYGISKTLPINSEDFSKTVTFTETAVYDENGDLLEFTGEGEAPGVTATTDFVLIILPDKKTLSENAEVIGPRGGTGSGESVLGDAYGGGQKVASIGLRFEPPMIAALVSGMGYLACTGIERHVIGKRKRNSQETE